MAHKTGWFPARRDGIIHMDKRSGDHFFGKRGPRFSLADLRQKVFITLCRQTPRFQDGPYCPIVPRIIAQERLVWA